MSGKGNCYGNATVETFFKTIKPVSIEPSRIWFDATPREFAYPLPQNPDFYHSSGILGP